MYILGQLRRSSKSTIHNAAQDRGTVVYEREHMCTPLTVTSVSLSLQPVLEVEGSVAWVPMACLRRMGREV